MNDLQKMEQEKSVLRWGGLAGIVGGILLVAVFVIVGVFVGPDPAEPEGLVMRFPDVRAAHIVEEVLYLGVLALWAIHFLALYRALRATSLAPALFGSALSIMGLIVLAAGALPQVARTPISDLYHAPGAPPEDQATLVLLWQATQGMLDALLVTGLLAPADRSPHARSGDAQGPSLWKGLWLGKRDARRGGGRRCRRPSGRCL